MDWMLLFQNRQKKEICIALKPPKETVHQCNHKPNLATLATNCDTVELKVRWYNLIP